ncbi:hypothetical protein [Tenacibaculum sp. IB213877]|nr:hypothetical protein [Tenacibaculum sp. IB213877]MDY0781108.1 hypothetical protein [Tenacibaculum sp. IB213877]
MIRSTTIKTNINTIKVLERMSHEKDVHRKNIIARIKQKAKDNK